MISKEEKQRIIEETIERIKDARTEGPNELIEAVMPLANMYQKMLLEVINPSCSVTVGVLAFALKTALAAIEKEMDMGDKALLALMERNITTISGSVEV